MSYQGPDCILIHPRLYRLLVMVRAGHDVANRLEGRVDRRRLKREIRKAEQRALRAHDARLRAAPGAATFPRA